MHQQHQSQAKAFYTWLEYSLHCALPRNKQDKASPTLTSDGEPSWQLSTSFSASDAQTCSRATSTDTHMPFRSEGDGSAQPGVYIPTSSSSIVKDADAGCHVDVFAESPVSARMLQSAEAEHRMTSNASSRLDGYRQDSWLCLRQHLVPITGPTVPLSCDSVLNSDLSSVSHTSSESGSAQTSRLRPEVHSVLQTAPAPVSAASLRSVTTAASVPHPNLNTSSSSVTASHSGLRAEPSSALSAQSCSGTATQPLQNLLSQLQRPLSQLQGPLCQLSSDTSSGTHENDVQAAHAQLGPVMSEHSFASASNAGSGACSQNVAISHGREQQLAVPCITGFTISTPSGTRNARLKALARKTPTRPPTPVNQQASDRLSSHLSSMAASDRHGTCCSSNTEGSDLSTNQYSGNQVSHATTSQPRPDRGSSQCTGNLGNRDREVPVANINLSDRSGGEMLGFGESRTVRRSLWAAAAPSFF